MQHQKKGFFVALILGFLSVGCSPQNDTSNSAGILVRSLAAEPDSLDPQHTDLAEAQTVLRDLCDGLFVLDHQARLGLGVAQSYSKSPDGRTYTFQLRPNARWSDGTRVVAADFVRGLRRLADPAVGSPYGMFADSIVNAPQIRSQQLAVDQLGVTAPAEGTLVIQLSAPRPDFLQMLSHPSACPVPPAQADTNQRVHNVWMNVTNGAFVLKEWKHQSYLLLAPNPYYIDRSVVHLSGVKYLVIANAEDQLRRYRSGELHVTTAIPRGEFDWVKSHLQGQLRSSPKLAVYFYGFNLERAPFKDNLALRQSLSLAIDRELLAESLLRVGERPAGRWIPPDVDGYRAPPSAGSDHLSTAERIALARRRYAEAGYSPAHPVQFQLRFNDGEVHPKLAVAIASMWKEVLGADVSLWKQEFGALNQDVRLGQVEMFRSSWIADYNDPSSFADYFLRSGVNQVRYQNPAYDRLLSHAQRAQDPETRIGLLQQAEELLLADQPIIPIYFMALNHLVQPSVVGWYQNPLDVVYSKDITLRPAASRSVH